MKCYKLNERGIAEFNNFIQQLSCDQTIPIPSQLLTDQNMVDALPFHLELTQESFDSRYEMGDYLVGLLAPYDVQSLLGDRGFWSWLALYWFKDLCPIDQDGLPKPRDHVNYILHPHPWKQPRHAIRTSYQLVRKYGEDSRFLLCNPMSTRGDLTEQLSTRQFYIECEGVVRAASILYYDASKKWFKKRSASNKRGGDVRRYVRFLRQIELTYDLYTLEAEQLLDLLPDEFDEFQIVA